MKRYFLLFAVLYSTASCEKMLDIKPADFVSEEAFFRTEGQLLSGLAAVYDALDWYGTTPLQRGNFYADEGFGRGGGSAGLSPHDFDASNTNVDVFWTSFYTGISRANLLLANIDNNPEIDEVYRNQIRGEALFLRAYYYFMLVHSFGGVPLVLEPVTSPNQTDVPRAPAGEVYRQILDDMKQAEQWVPHISAWGFGGRVSKSAVRGILARVCIHMAGYPLRDASKYAEARDWAKKVMDDDQAAHRLNPDFTQVFINYAQDKYDIHESIWEVEFWGDRTNAYLETGWIGYVNGPNSSNLLTGSGFGGIRPTAHYYRLFGDGDVRRDWTISNFTYSNTGPAGTKVPITNVSNSALYNRRGAKWRREYELLDRTTANTPQNFALLRYSDVLLMFAEAENEINNGPTANAYDAINLVRRRAFGKLLPDATDIDEHDLSGLDYTGFWEEIIKERARELGYELLRKGDLIRWGIYVSTMHNIGEQIAVHVANADFLPYYMNVQPKHVLFPIPSREMTLNKAMVQNEGWD